MQALQTASKVLPRIVAASYRYQYFPTTRGWAEMNHQDDLAKFAGEEGSDIQQFENQRTRPTDSHGRRHGDAPSAGDEPVVRADQRRDPRPCRARPGGGGQRIAGNEFLSTVDRPADSRRSGALPLFAPACGAVAYNLYKSTGALRPFDEAIEHEKRAVQAWSEIVAAAGDVYSTELAFGAHSVGLPPPLERGVRPRAGGFRKAAGGSAGPRRSPVTLDAVPAVTSAVAANPPVAALAVGLARRRPAGTC